MKLQIIMILTITIFLVSCGGSSMRTAIIDTNQGTIRLELFTDTMPITTKNFIDLADKGFYEGTRVHRVIGPAKMPPQGFMIQGGDPKSKELSQKASWGTGGPGYKIEDEFTANNKNNRGTISMANAGPNTGGSQFFINLANNDFLDDKHPVFGKVIGGMDIVDKIGKAATDNQDKPLDDVIVKKITIK